MNELRKPQTSNIKLVQLSSTPSTSHQAFDPSCCPISFQVLSTLVNNKQRYASRASRSPSAVTGAVPVAEYHEWPFHGLLKRTRIGKETTYNLEFQSSDVPEHLHIPILSEA